MHWCHLSIFYSMTEKGSILLIVYVDDIIIFTGDDTEGIEVLRNIL